MHQMSAFSTELGWMAVVRSGRVVNGLSMGHASRDDALAAVAQRMTLDTPITMSDEEPLADLLRRYATGEELDFRAVQIDTTTLSRFASRVIRHCRKIRWGETRTYGDLARAVGVPHAARAVGRVMANNRLPLVVPCHRVVAAGGRLGGFSAPEGVTMKRRLLALEGGLPERGPRRGGEPAGGRAVLSTAGNARWSGA